jgi:hypothetical protein
MSEVKIMQSKIDKMILEEVVMLKEDISMEELRAVYEKDFKRPSEADAQDPEGHAQVRFEMFGDGFFDGQASERSETGQNFFGTNADWANSNMDNAVSEDYMNGYDYATNGKAEEHAAQAQGQPEAGAPEDEMTPGREQIAMLVPEIPVDEHVSLKVKELQQLQEMVKTVFKEESIKISKTRVKQIIKEELEKDKENIDIVSENPSFPSGRKMKIMKDALKTRTLNIFKHTKKMRTLLSKWEKAGLRGGGTTEVLRKRVQKSISILQDFEMKFSESIENVYGVIDPKGRDKKAGELDPKTGRPRHRNWRPAQPGINADDFEDM